MVKKASQTPVDHQAKIVSLEVAAKHARRLRRAGKKVVTSNGAFDILHVGHVRSLAFAKAQGDVLFLGVSSDASVRRNKGKGRPVVPARERAEVLAALAAVDYVFIFGEDIPVAWIKKIKPHVHVKSSDYNIKTMVEREAVEQGGGVIKLFTHTGRHSSTKLMKKISHNTK